MMRKEYVNAFRQALEKRQIDPNELTLNITDAQTVNTLIVSLDSDNEREVVYALDMLASVEDEKLVEKIGLLLNHESSEVRRKAITVLRRQEDKSLLPVMKKKLNDSDPEVRRDAIAFICEHGEGDRRDMLQSFLKNDDLMIRVAAAGCIAEYGTPDEKSYISDEIVNGLLNYEGEEVISIRVQLAKAFKALPQPVLKSALRKLMNDSSPDVVRQCIESLGRLKEREHIPWLIDKLADITYRGSARKALAAYGSGVLGTLGDYLKDKRVKYAIRSSIPRVISNIRDQHSADLLIESLDRVEPRLKYFVLKALNRLRATYSDLEFNERRIDDALIEETKSYYEILHIVQLQRKSDDPAGQLLEKALKEKQDHNLEQIFRLLGLFYPAKDIYNAYLGIVSSKKVVRANAVEFLDNLLRSNVKKYILPIVDDAIVELALRRGRELFGVRFESQEQALAHLIKGRDNWLKACAIYASSKVSSPELKQLVREAVNDSDPVVRETAELMR
jgi:AAA family ATP:ADP antiporter